jgi:hypothetical protein
VFVDPDLIDKWLRHTALEEKFQAFGPSNDSPATRDSLLFESDTLAGTHERLGHVDGQVLWLLYTVCVRAMAPSKSSEQCSGDGCLSMP